jgi:hypothetical protein
MPLPGLGRCLVGFSGGLRPRLLSGCPSGAHFDPGLSGGRHAGGGLGLPGCFDSILVIELRGLVRSEASRLIAAGLGYSLEVVRDDNFGAGLPIGFY